MANIIKPRDFLLRLKNEGTTATVIKPSDILEVAELGITFPFSRALDEAGFYDLLKKATSDFNSEAALSGNPPVDFDDLYTKYSEYVEALEIFIHKSD